MDGFLTSLGQNRGMAIPNSPSVFSAPSLAQALRRGSKTYDLLAAAPLMVWFAMNAAVTLRPMSALIAHLLQAPNVPLCLMVLSKCGVLLFAFVAIAMLVTRRPPKSGAHGLAPRVASLLGTYLTIGIVLLPPAHLSPLWLGISAALILGGMAFSCFSILWLGRSFSLMAEARRLVTSGPYSVIRHPLYLGEEVAIVGMAIQFFSPEALALLLLQMACQVYRMGCEEEVLADAFPDYTLYKSATARLVPGVY
jgi:protein-S-isoprenylcysteine O-methyltransferase Ste14